MVARRHGPVLHQLTLLDPDPSLRPLHALRAGVVEARMRAFHRWGYVPEPGRPISLGQAVDGVPAELTQELDDATRNGTIAVRTAVRCLHLAWTMADLDGRPQPATGDIRLILAQRRRAYQLLRIPVEPQAQRRSLSQTSFPVSGALSLPTRERG